MSATTLVVFGTVLMSVLAASAPRRRSVEKEITLPNNAVARAAAPEGEGVVVKLVDGTRFGFVPSVSQSDNPVVSVSIWDVDGKPMQELGSVTLIASDQQRKNGRRTHK